MALDFSFCGISPVGTIAAMGISLQQFEQMKARVKSPRRTSTPCIETPRIRTSRPPQIIIGIDPSLRGTGFGVIRTELQPQMIACGTLTCPATWKRSRCLAKIAQALRETLRTTQPTVCVVEGLFFAQNLQTALIMGEARGAALAVIAEAGLDIYEIAPRKVKQAIVGYGAAQKLAVAKMVQRMLKLDQTPAPDAADALALALAFAQTHNATGLNAPRQV